MTRSTSNFVHAHVILKLITFDFISSMMSAQRLRMLSRRMSESMSACSRKAWSFSTRNFERFIGNWPSGGTKK